MANDLEIQIGANVGNLSKGFQTAESQLKSFAAKASATSAALGGSMAKGTNQAGFALQNLGRVAQDAPFGFIGIQNNIGPLIESFQRLKTASGSTGGALKALAGSLVGGGGLLLGVSLVTSALTVLAQNPEKVAGALNYLSGVVGAATGTQKAYNEALEENESKAKIEIVSLTNLIAIASDETLSRNARTEALKASKKEYPEQLEFLTLENIGSRKAAEAIDILSQSLLRKAKIQAAEKILGDAFVKQLQAQTQSVTEQASTLDKLVGGALNAIGVKNTIVLNEGFKNQQKAIKDTATEINVYTALLKKLNTEEAKAGTLFNDPVKKPGKVVTPENKRDSQLGAALTETKIGIGTLLQQYEKTQALINFIPLVPFPETVRNGLGALSAEFIRFNGDLTSIIDNGISNTLAGLGDAIGNALISGSNIAGALGASLLSSLGSVLGQLGQMAIATGVAILGIKTALKTLNPVVAIAAGVGLLALSGAVKAGAAKLGGGMGSGGSGGGGSSSSIPSYSGIQSGSSVNNFNGGRVVFEISGQKLVGVLSNVQNANKRIQGP